MALRALFMNGTLRKSPSVSNTQAIIDKAVKLFKEEGVDSEVIRLIDHNLEMAYYEAEEQATDDWSSLFAKIKSCDIFIIGTPITMGMCSSAVHAVLEKMNGSSETADRASGQFPFYGKVAGVIVSGCEDGAHEVAAKVLFNLSRQGFTVPPNAEAYWIGPAGNGPAYIEAHGERHFHTNKTLRYLVKNCTFFAQLLRAHPITTNILELYEAARKESSDSFQVQVQFTPGLRYRRQYTRAES